MQFPSFRTIAGDLVEYSMGSHRLVGERIELAGLASRMPVGAIQRRLEA